jgi:multidrug efflux pump subunit AcrB/outer membrane protein TolC
MTFVERCLEQRKLVITLVVLLAGLGLVSWLTMIRQEDPQLPDYFGRILVHFPGADAETVERLVVEPVEESLAEVDEVLRIESTAWAELTMIIIDLREDLSETDTAWDRVRQALDKARRDFPEGVGEPILDDRVMDATTVLYAVTGSADPLVLAAAADRLKDELLAVPGTAEVEIIADPGDQITIELDDSGARRLGLTPGMLVAQLAARSRIVPGGSLHLEGQNVRLRPRTDFESLAEIRATPVRLPGGEMVPLSTIAEVRRGPEEPARFRARFEGTEMVSVGVVPRRHINLVRFGDAVRERVAAFAPTLAPLEVDEIAFQPARVAARLSGLVRSLLLGAAIVAGVLILFMGPRLGLVVTAIVPLVTLSSIGIFNLGGGVLHQISIAALVIALGMLVDNGIVVSEAIQWGLDRGLDKAEAARRAVRDLATPLAAATATTLAAFVPMLLARSTTGDFTRAIPVVVMLTLTVSFLFAMLVTPILGQIFLKPGTGRGNELFGRFASRVASLAVGRPVLVVLLAVALVGSSFLGARWVDLEFFPGADRNQFVVELRLPEGSHLDATDQVARRLERQLLARPEVASVSTFVGRSAPRFYYNINQIPWSPHFGHLIVETTSTATVDPAVAWTRDYARQEVPEAEVVLRTLEQGPPLPAPVELRLYSKELPALAGGVEMVVRELRRTPGAVDVRHSLSNGAPLLEFEIDDAAAARRGLTRVDVAAALYGRTRGLTVGQYRAEDDPLPVVVRSSQGEEMPVDDLASVDVSAPGASPVPLAQIARIEVDWRPAAIGHYNGRRVASVYSQLEPGASYSDVIADVMPRIDQLELPPGIELRIGGAAEESGSANAAIIRMVPIGLILLLGILLAEFRSFRRVTLVLVTVPLAAAGVVPGLLVGDQPFGFMSTLGVVALIGIVVNNAIVLLEVIEASRKDGADVPTAVRQAIERRLRPILLTTATTVAGLLPLALSDSSLWPPMAWALISGLTASTVLTLLVVPALYLLLFSPGDFWRRRRPAQRLATATGLAVLALAGAGSLSAQTGSDPERITLAEALLRGAGRPRVEAAEGRARAALLGARAERRAGLWPTLSLGGGISERDRTLLLATPIGSFPFQPARAEELAVRVTQPLFEPARQLYEAPAARAEAESAGLAAERSRQAAAAEAAEAFLAVLAVDAALSSTEALIDSLRASLAETEARVAAGRVLESEALKVRLALDSAGQNRLALTERRAVATRGLGRAVGLDGPVEPAWDGAADTSDPPTLEAAVAEATERRSDLAALREQIRALDLRRRAVRAERWPSLEATATWTYSTGTPFEQDEWVEGGVGLRWAPFRSGTVAPRAAAAAEQIAALEADYLEAARGVELEIAAALAELATARGAVQVGERGVAQATETVRVERERYQAGRITANDLLEAEAALRRESTRRELAKLDVVRAGIRLELALGHDPSERHDRAPAA